MKKAKVGAKSRQDSGNCIGVGCDLQFARQNHYLFEKLAITFQPWTVLKNGRMIYQNYQYNTRKHLGANLKDNEGESSLLIFLVNFILKGGIQR